MKLLCVCSTLDLDYGYGCTPAWWQFFKGLYELGHDLIAIPYQGSAITTPWWRTYPNPCRVEGETYAAVRKVSGKGAALSRQGLGAKITRGLIDHWIKPRWEQHLARVLETEKDIAAVIVFTVPVNHLSGIPQRLRARYGVPFYYFDGDVPASLPRFGGFASGFNIYQDATLAEYDGVFCNSTGGADDLRELGAKWVETVHWGVDPDLYRTIEAEPDTDVLFYGFGTQFREAWIRAMLIEPSMRLADKRFVFSGRGFDGERGRTEYGGDVPFNVFRQACARSRINLNIVREAHASVFASSSMRPFELAAMGCCIVSNPYPGLETWFDIGRDLVVVPSAEEAVETYSRLLADPAARRAMGESARRRVLEQHTHCQRAAQIVNALAR